MQASNGRPRSMHSMEFISRVPARASVVCLALLAMPPLTSCSTLEGEVGTWLMQLVDPAAPFDTAPSAGPATTGQDAPPAKEAAEPSAAERRDPALSDPGFASIPPAGRDAGVDPYDAADDWAVQMAGHLSELVAKGVMVELYVNDSNVEKPRPSPIPIHVVQIGSHREMSSAERHLETAAAGAGALLSPHKGSIQIADLAGRGRFYRVHFGPLPSQQDARSLCRALQDQGHACIAQEQVVVAGPSQEPERPSAAESRLAGAVNLASADVSALAVGMTAPRRLDLRHAEEMPLFTAPGLPGVLD